MDVDNPPRVIVVTSPLPGDGKSTTAANLATSLAAADGVLLVTTAGKTTFDMVDRAIESITRASGHIIGMVMNKVPKTRSSYYGYQYREHCADDPKKATRQAR